jgi:thiol:disulfide interchange protein DsbA
MKTMIANLIAVLALLFCNAAPASVEQGKDFKLLNPAQPARSGQIEVLEFFSYACVHCYHLHQSMAPWKSSIANDVRLTHVPVVFTDSWEPMARLHYALQSLGLADALDDEIYKEVHVRHLDLSNQLSTKPSRLDFIQQLAVDPDKFSAAYSSPGVERKLADGSKLEQLYQIRGTPTLVVDGKYLITGLTPDRTVQALNEVIELARKSRPVAAPEAVKPATPPAATTPAPMPQPASKRPTSRKHAKAKQPRSMELDLRHCLDLESNAAIAKCAGE